MNFGDADCLNCLGDLLPTRMIVCPKCGNKRCPKATDHRLKCTGSNDLGQPGSAYRDWRPSTATELGRFDGPLSGCPVASEADCALADLIAGVAK